MYGRVDIFKRVVWSLIGFAAIASATVFVHLAVTDVRVETQTKVVPPKVTTAAAAANALGKPAGEFPCADLNPELAGATCSVYQYTDGIAVVAR